MKQYFDASVLVAAFVEDEVHHEECADLVGNAKEGMVHAHGLAECFSILTGGRLSVQLSADVATSVLEANVVDRMKIITLTSRETLKVLKNAQRSGIRGGGIYDALHLAAARKGQAEEIFTLNLRHFTAFAPDLLDWIICP